MTIKASPFLKNVWGDVRFRPHLWIFTGMGLVVRAGLAVYVDLN